MFTVKKFLPLFAQKVIKKSYFYRNYLWRKALNSKNSFLDEDFWRQHPERGKEKSERFIEISWVKKLYRGEEVVLDVGYANAEKKYYNEIASLKIPSLIGLDLDYQEIPIYKYRIVGDICNTPIRDSYFDLIICISTLEHIGMDNTIYNQSKESNPQKQVATLEEMERITKPQGRILLTLPFGRLENHGWFIQYDLALLKKLVFSTTLLPATIEFFSCQEKFGWNKIPYSKTKKCKYRVKESRASCVVCLELVKP